MDLTIEDSCKFSIEKPYNDERWTAILNDPIDKDIKTICKKLKFDGFLLDFYKYKEKIWDLPSYKVSEFGVGLDMNEISKKLYYNIDGHVYGAGIKSKKAAFRHYRCVENYPKPQIVELIGEKDTIFEIISDYKPEYKDFFHNATWVCFEERGSSNIESLFKAKPDCYHISLRSLEFKIEENSKLIKKILKSRNCDIKDIDKWISKNSQCKINLIGLSKDDVTFYYDRINKE